MPVDVLVRVMVAVDIAMLSAGDAPKRSTGGDGDGGGLGTGQSAGHREMDRRAVMSWGD